MKSLINRRGSKAATRAMKRFGTGTKKLTHPSAAKTVNPENPACNTCENHEFYTPEQKKSIERRRQILWRTTLQK